MGSSFLPHTQKNSITQNTKKARLPGTAQKTFLLSGSKSFIASLPSLIRNLSKALNMDLSLTPRAAQMLYSEHPYDSYLTRLGVSRLKFLEESNTIARLVKPPL